MRKIIFLLLSVAAPLLGVADPEAFYLTWQDDPCTTMRVCWISDLEQPVKTIEVQREGSDRWQLEEGRATRLPDRRGVLYVADLKSLSPSTRYLFRFSPKSKPLGFRTLPRTLDQPLRFVVGGDLYRQCPGTFMKANRHASLRSPHFAVLGGDIAYTADQLGLFPEHSNRWISFFTHWAKEMRDPDGNVVPMVATIGNHEVKGGYNAPRKAARYFYLFFREGTRPAYEVFDVGDYLSLILLDTNHTEPVEGKQTAWLEQTLKKRAGVPHRFAVYHVPAYPARKPPTNKKSKAIVDNWVPLFESHGIPLVFEHHEHVYKRTTPILGGQQDPKGIVYMGDGGWGVPARDKKQEEPAWYLERYESISHFIEVELSGKQCSVQAIDSRTGETFDQVIL